MQIDVIDLLPLIEFCRSDPDCSAFAHKSDLGKRYGELAKSLTARIPDEKGFYFWGSLRPDGAWYATYVGKAHKGLTNSLRIRIEKELKNERAFLWRTVFPGEDQYFIERWLAHYPDRANSSGSLRHITKALR